jgi:hypothetical protein
MLKYDVLVITYLISDFWRVSLMLVLMTLQLLTGPSYITSWHRPRRKRAFHYCCVLSLPWKHACLQNHYLAMLLFYSEAGDSE